MSDDTLTINDQHRHEALGASSAPQVALVLVYCSEQPERLGEVLWAPQRGAAMLGRGGVRPDDPLPRLGLHRLRPGQCLPTAPLEFRWLSRHQLSLSRVGEQLLVENVGRCPLLLRGLEVPSGPHPLTPGEVLELGPHLAFLCARIPRELPTWPGCILHPFGGPDQDGIVGESEATWELRRTVQFLAPRQGHVLIQGPSGTGKELVALALHAGNGRRGPFVSRNAATIPEGLIDAELFGNIRDYPNPGMPERRGLIGTAHGGTLFLDEIGELPEALQAHLLRVLDSGEYQRLGEGQTRHADIRLIAATNRPEASLKEDLLARLPLRIHTPPLGTRRADLPLLVQHLLRGIAAREADLARRFFVDDQPQLSIGLLRELLLRDYRTHIREVEALLWQSMVASPEGVLLPPPPAPVSATAAHPAAAAPATAGGQTGADWRGWVGQPASALPAAVIQACLDDHNGNQEEAWVSLGLSSRHVLGRLIRRHGLVVRRRR